MSASQDIRPIETIYKGYRFRSRLEARWAVFLDQLGIGWEYEAQGYEVGGERYLPDFYISSLKTFVEIKSEHLRCSYKKPAVYMAGRMDQHDYRDFDISEHYQYPHKVEPRHIVWRGLGISYCGPFSIDEKAHTSEHGNGNRDSVYERSISGIDQCDVFFAYLGDQECFGTLVEIGYAIGKKKEVIIGVDSALNYGGNAESEVAEMWFAAQGADTVVSGNKASVLSQFARYLRDHHSPPREYRLAKSLADTSGEGVFLCYGDPVETIQKGWYSFNRSGLGASLKSLPHYTLDRAATAARQARFEHGQSGGR